MLYHLHHCILQFLFKLHYNYCKQSLFLNNYNKIHFHNLLDRNQQQLNSKLEVGNFSNQLGIICIIFYHQIKYSLLSMRYMLLQCHFLSIYHIFLQMKMSSMSCILCQLRNIYHSHKKYINQQLLLWQNQCKGILHYIFHICLMENQLQYLNNNLVHIYYIIQPLNIQHNLKCFYPNYMVCMIIDQIPNNIQICKKYTQDQHLSINNHLFYDIYCQIVNTLVDILCV